MSRFKPIEIEVLRRTAFPNCLCKRVKMRLDLREEIGEAPAFPMRDVKQAEIVFLNLKLAFDDAADL